ncbi:hypothetical protein GA0070604_4931 [Micromonospora eburnea]|uniref:Uncharacterized protein n=1 Tax=Micromonospora eburnea TaxID=227316 RepID=A0A1C6VAA8_9ACTN|nr:hypothetical protein GA0070604_4931 [Micromonospora eburnea]
MTSLNINLAGRPTMAVSSATPVRIGLATLVEAPFGLRTDRWWAVGAT